MEMDWEDETDWATVNPQAREYDALFAHLSDEEFAALDYSPELALRLSTIPPPRYAGPHYSSWMPIKTKEEEEQIREERLKFDEMVRTPSRELYDHAIEKTRKDRVLSKPGRDWTRNQPEYKEKLRIQQEEAREAGRVRKLAERAERRRVRKRRLVLPGVGVERKVSKDWEIYLGMKLTGGEFELGPHESQIKLEEDPTTAEIPCYSARLEWKPSHKTSEPPPSLVDVLALPPKSRSANLPHNKVGMIIRARTLSKLPPAAPRPLRLHSLPVNVPRSYHLRDSPIPIEPTPIAKNDRLFLVDTPTSKRESAARHLRDDSLLAVTPTFVEEERTPAQNHPRKRKPSSPIVDTSPSTSGSTAPPPLKRQQLPASHSSASPTQHAETRQQQDPRRHVLGSKFQPNPKAKGLRTGGSRSRSSAGGGANGVPAGEEMDAAKAKQIERERLAEVETQRLEAEALEEQRRQTEELDLRKLERIATLFPTGSFGELEDECSFESGVRISPSRLRLRCSRLREILQSISPPISSLASPWSTSQLLEQVCKLSLWSTPSEWNDRRRSDLLRLQGEFPAQLHFLEPSLFAALSESSGNILDDDKSIGTLETLKREAAEDTRKVEEIDSVMAEVEQVTRDPSDSSSTSSTSSSFTIPPSPASPIPAHDSPSSSTTCSSTSLNELLELYSIPIISPSPCSSRKSSSLDQTLHSPRLISTSSSRETKEASELSILDATQQGRLEAFSRLPSFKAVAQHIKENAGEWNEFLQLKTPEFSIPQVCYITRSPKAAARQMLPIRSTTPRIHEFIGSTFGLDLLAESPYELGSMVVNEIAANSPVCLVSVPGYDSASVDSLVSSTNSRCTSVAMGGPV